MRNRVYFNVREKNLSVLDYKTNKVTKKVTQAYLTNAMFVVRKSGNKRVREEGRKNVHAFVNGIIQPKLVKGSMPQHEVCRVRYDPYTMDCFHYERIVNGKSKWLPVDKHWIGKVYLNVVNGKPIILADIDKLLNDDTNLLNDDTNLLNDDTSYLIASNIQKALKKSSGHNTVDQIFLRRKRKIIENKNKIIDKTIAI